MITYYIPLLILLLLLPLDFFGHKPRLFAVIIAACVAGLFSGLRGIGVDNDSLNYFDIFRSIANLDLLSLKSYSADAIVELGFVYINFFVHAIGGNFFVFQFLMSILTSMLLAYYVYSYSHYPLLSIFLYFCIFFLYRDFTQIRFGISCLVCMIAVARFIDGQRWQALVLYIIASTIHSASIALIIFIPIWYARSLISTYLFFMGCMASVLLSFAPITDLVAAIIGLPAQLARYLLNPSDGNLKLAMLVITLFPFLWFVKAKTITNTDASIGICLLISGFWGIVFRDFGIMSRVQFLFATPVILALPVLTARYKGSLKFVIYIAIVFCGIGYYYKQLTTEDFVRPYELYTFSE